MTRHTLIFAFLFFSIVTVAQETTFTRVINNDSTDQSVAFFQNTIGDYYILSNTNSDGQGGVDFQVTRADGLGNTLWSYTYGTSLNDYGLSMKPTSDGGAVICGYSLGFSSSTDEQAFIAKLTSAGAVTWSKQLLTDSNARALDVIQSKNGNYYLTGYIEQDTMDRNMLASRIDGSGNVSWVKTLGGDGDDIGYSIAEDAKGRLVIAGGMANDSVNVGGTGDMDISLMVLSTGGNVLTSKNFGTNENDYATKIVSHTDKNLYLGGMTDGASGISTDVFVAKIDTNLSLLASSWYGVAGGQDNKLDDFIVLANGNMLAATSASDFITTRNSLVYEIDNFNGVSAPGKFGGMDADGLSRVYLAGRTNSGYSVLHSGKSFGSTNTEDIYITKLKSEHNANCVYGIDNLSFGALNLSASVFANATSQGSNSTVSFTRSSITNSDTVLCCDLESRVIGDSLKMCVGDVVNLGRQSISGYQYSWTTISGPTYTSSISNPNVSPNASSEYKLVVSSADGLCNSDSGTVYVTVKNRINQNFIADTNFCDGDSLILTATSGMNFYEWSFDGSNTIGKNRKVTKSGTATLYTIDNNSCIYRDTVVVAETLLPVFTLGEDTTICENLSITLSGPSDMSEYIWNGTSTTMRMFTTRASQVHTLKVVDSFGCEYSDAIQILTNPFSTFSLGNDTAICIGTPLTLFIPSVLKDYKWNGSSTTNPSIEVSSGGAYFAEAKNSFDCPSYDTIVVSELALPIFSLGNDTGFCNQVSYQLDGPENVKSYLWQNGTMMQSLSVNGAGLFYLEVEGANDCVYKDSITISLYTSPTITLGNDTIIPASGSLTLTPGAGFSEYDWSTGESTESISVSDTGTYSVTVTDANGCTASDEIRVPSTASIAYLDKIKFSVYPNPASSKLIIIKEGDMSNITAALVDAQGKVIVTQKLNAVSSQIDVSVLPSGLYKLILYSDAKSLNFSISVIH